MDFNMLWENINNILNIDIFGIFRVSDLIIMSIALIIGLHVFRTLSRG